MMFVLSFYTDLFSCTSIVELYIIFYMLFKIYFLVEVTYAAGSQIKFPTSCCCNTSRITGTVFSGRRCWYSGDGLHGEILVVVHDEHL
jgi:hypothetical protein